LYYSFDYGPIHFVAISSEREQHSFELQKQFLETDLSRVDREVTPFVIFYTHRPMYSSNQNHGSDINLRKVFEPVLLKNKVDLALFGHVHAYGMYS